MIKAIIFDCFGVLVGRGFSETYQLAGGDPVADRDFIDNLLGQANTGQITVSEMRNRITQQLNIDDATWEAAVKSSEQPNEQLFEYISRLPESYKTAVLSNANIGTVRRVLSEEQYQLFDAVVVSAEVRMVKPQAEIYIHTAETLGVSPAECVFTDDIKSYVDAAEATGMTGLLYTDFKQLKSNLDTVLSHA